MKIKVSTPLGYKRLHRNSKPKQGDAWLDSSFPQTTSSNDYCFAEPVLALTAIEQETFRNYSKTCFFFRPINTNT